MFCATEGTVKVMVTSEGTGEGYGSGVERLLRLRPPHHTQMYTHANACRSVYNVHRLCSGIRFLAFI